MECHTVALVPVAGYDEQKVYEAVETGISLLGGWERFVSENEKILLKPNLLSGSLPQKAVTTHPAVFGAVAASLRKAGYSCLQYGDSPGNPATSPDKAADLSGIREQAERYGIEKADFDGGSIVRFPEGKTAKSFYLCSGVQQADALISICKMKTHALERITGAVKNLYGCICGVNKAAGHALYPSGEKFADMLADLHLCVRPRLHIMDGIIAMEGNGPSSGTPVRMNVLLFSSDPVALDTVFCRLIDLDPASVPTCPAGARAGIGTMNTDEIRIVTPDGEISAARAAELYGKPDFDVFREKLRESLIMKFMPLLPVLQHRPKADMKRCVGCGICQEACPVPEKAVKSGNGKKAVYDYKKCIRCYCCQEMCPVKAISVYRSPLNKLLGGK
ncbi:MAG: DUF362 domain-containing protein [Clostridia bacterium]|nr:DUF362 domain-containing protein [Clostridia bacterium]